MAGFSVPLDEVVHFDVITSNPSTGAVSDADSTPTFDVYEEATDTGMLGATNLTKRTSLTGNYRGTFTASAANGFEVGKWYNVIASATVNSVAGKVAVMTFMLRAAENTAGYEVITIKSGTGTGEVKLSSGYVAPNWGDVGNPTTVVNLSNTTFSTVGTLTNDPTGVTTILSRLSATRAGYLDNLSGGAVALASGVVVASNGISRSSFVADTGLQTTRSNTAQAGGATSITLDASASSTTDFYINQLAYLTGGTGVGQSRFITAYNGTTKVATVNSAWATNPDNTSTFAIIPFDAIPGATAPTAAQVADAVWDEARSGHTAVGSFGEYVLSDVKLVSGDSVAADNLEALLDGTGGITLVASAFTLTTPITANATQISGDATAADNAESFFDGTGYAGTNNVIPTVTTLTNDPAGVTTLLARIPAALFSGITSLAQWLGIVAGKQVGDTTARTELRATGAGSGTFDETAHSLEAIRARGDVAWVTATGFSNHSAADVWAVATRTLTAGTNIVLAKGAGVTGFTDIDAAGVRTAVGLATANLDTQLGNIVADTNELQTDWTNGGRLDVLIDAIKDKTDPLTFTNANKVDAAVLAIADLATAVAQKIAHVIIRRTMANVEAAVDGGDTLDISSLYGLIQQAQESNTTAHAGKLTVFKTDGTTELAQKTLATDPASEPVTGVS